MVSHLVTALRACLVTLVVCCGVYPLVVTGLGQLLFPEQANGSLVTDGTGGAVGSELIGQAFRRPAYLQGRPSAAGQGYDAGASGGSNLGPTSAKLRARAVAEARRLREENPEAPGPVPGELVTASASGLDPHVSPQAARWQVPRVARARGVAPERVQALVDAYTEGRTLGLLGEPRVNVLRVNLALDRQLGVPMPERGAGAEAPSP